MTIDELKACLTVPVIAAPMYLVSGPELVIAACKAGVVGAFNGLNAQSAEECDAWLGQIGEALAQARAEGGTGTKIAPPALNIIVRPSERVQADIVLAEKHEVPLLLTGVGDPTEIVKRVHGYGGLVFHDVATVRHAEKAIAAGVDGLILLTAGAGGHTGQVNPFAFVRQVRAFWDGALVLAGGLSDGQAVAAATMLGADFAYMGTRFAATQEARTSDAYRELLVGQRMSDVIVTDRISGLPATFMRGSIMAAGLEPDNLPAKLGPFQPDLPEHLKPWRDIWSAGQGVGSIDDIPPVADLVGRLAADYRQALAR